MGNAERMWAHVRITRVTSRHDETLHATSQQCVQHLKLALCRPTLSAITLVQQRQAAQSDKGVNPVRKAGRRFACLRPTEGTTPPSPTWWETTCTSAAKSLTSRRSRFLPTLHGLLAWFAAWKQPRRTQQIWWSAAGANTQCTWLATHPPCLKSQRYMPSQHVSLVI